MTHNEIFKIQDTHGNDVEMELIDLIKMDNKEYIIAGPKNSNEAYAYRVTRLGEEIQYTSIGTGDEFNRVLRKYNEGE
ncbi:DUF1292 domain-containing protein [Clostridium sp. UBA6640]|uniref:DUF1292 domain-containing protein n=1 Tax=Clostridium sp. UBA6640 TaxID=1946370 RepID=UPI0025BE44CF|nr:DUF1292 domain-containing protein [Clostridium sp. UBA6640]